MKNFAYTDIAGRDTKTYRCLDKQMIEVVKGSLYEIAEYMRDKYSKHSSVYNIRHSIRNALGRNKDHKYRGHTLQITKEEHLEKKKGS